MIDFIKKNERTIYANVPNFRMPTGIPPSGEISIQKTFTEEWSELGSDEIVFAYNKEEGLALHKEIC